MSLQLLLVDKGCLYFVRENWHIQVSNEVAPLPAALAMRSFACAQVAAKSSLDVYWSAITIMSLPIYDAVEEERQQVYPIDLVDAISSTHHRQ